MSAFRGLTFLFSLRTSSVLTTENRKSDLTFRSPVAITLGCFLHFSNNFKIGFVICTAKGFIYLNSAI